MDLKLKYSSEDVEDIADLLEKEMIKAQAEYILKKEAKGELINKDTMRKAMNQRKNLKKLCRISIAAAVSHGNLIDQPEVNRTVEKLEREANAHGKEVK